MNKTKKDYDTKLKYPSCQQSTDYILNAENKSKALWQVINIKEKKQTLRIKLNSTQDNR